MQNQVFHNIKKLLEENEKLRSSDKMLMLHYWRVYDNIHNLDFDFISKATHPETIRRTRQKIQEKYPYLKPQYNLVRDKLEAKTRNWVLQDKPEQQSFPL